MNEQPTFAAHTGGLDPDPLTAQEAWTDGFDIGYTAGYDKGVADALPRIGAVFA
jgi:hypothetical protein